MSWALKAISGVKPAGRGTKVIARREFVVFRKLSVCCYITNHFCHVRWYFNFQFPSHCVMRWSWIRTSLYVFVLTGVHIFQPGERKWWKTKLSVLLVFTWLSQLLTTFIAPLRKIQVYLRIFTKCLSLITPHVGWPQDINILRAWSSQ
jgi:hypothetical protein